MNLWISLALIAYLLFAINGVIDKFLLSKAVRHPIAYAFYIGITGPLTWVLAPFGLQWLGAGDLFIAIIGGASFVGALYFLYVATQATSISRILPIEGGLVPVFTLLFAYLFIGERLTSVQLLAFIFLVFGAVLVSLKKDASGWHPRALGNALLAAVLFAFSLVLTKYIFNKTNFVSGLVWTRLGFLLLSLLFLLHPKARDYIRNTPKSTSTGNKFLYYGARITGGVGGLLQNYAISLGSVSIVNALQGTQYAVLLFVTIFLSRWYPKFLREKISGVILAQKMTAIVFISVGLYFLTR